MFKGRRFTPAMIVAMIALGVALSGTAVAGTAKLITGNQIANGTIKLADIHSSAKTALKGKTGATGPQGPAGAQGPQGTGSGRRAPPAPRATTARKGDTAHRRDGCTASRVRQGAAAPATGAARARGPTTRRDARLADGRHDRWRVHSFTCRSDPASDARSR